MNEFFQSPALWLRLQLAAYAATEGTPGGIALSSAMFRALGADFELRYDQETGKMVDSFCGVPLVVVPDGVLPAGVPEVMSAEDTDAARAQLAQLPPPDFLASLRSQLVAGVPVVVSPMLPIVPSPGTDARRLVRHGMADVLAWLGEDVGPKPGEVTHALVAGGSLWVSQEAYDALVASSDVDVVTEPG